MLAAQCTFKLALFLRNTVLRSIRNYKFLIKIYHVKLSILEYHLVRPYFVEEKDNSLFIEHPDFHQKATMSLTMLSVTQFQN